MAWVESHQELWRHPKTKKLARLLGVSVPTAVGHLHGLWYWALDFADDGAVSQFDAEEIADAVMWDGEPQQLVEALEKSGFLDRNDDGLFLHDWSEYAGHFAELREVKREQARIRKQRQRQREREEKAEILSHADVTQVSRVTSRMSRHIPVPVPIPDNSSFDLSDESPNPDRSKNFFDEESKPFKLAKWLDKQISERSPHYQHRTGPQLQKWARTFDLMNRRDGIPWDDIRDVLSFSQQDPFWQANILSADKFRKQFIQLEAKMSKEAEKRGE